MRQLTFQIPAASSGERLDKAIAALAGLSRGEARRRLDAGAVYVDGRRIRVASRPVRPGQEVPVVLEEGGRAAGSAEALPRDRVLSLDDAVVAVDKPAGLAAQAALGGDRDALPARVSALLEATDVGLVHRLDRDTTGVTVFGRTRAATSALAKAFREGTVEKRYLALTWGVPDPAEGRLEAPLEPDPAARGRHRVAAPGHGIPAATGWRVIATVGEEAVAVDPPAELRVSGEGPEDPRRRPLALVWLRPETGRTHQLRVHLASMGCPILGDKRYGAPTALTLPDGKRIEAGRVLLHAMRLALPHPEGGRLAVEAPVPEDLAELVRALGGPEAGPAVPPEDEGAPTQAG